MNAIICLRVSQVSRRFWKSHKDWKMGSYLRQCFRPPPSWLFLPVGVNVTKWGLLYWISKKLAKLLQFSRASHSLWSSHRVHWGQTRIQREVFLEASTSCSGWMCEDSLSMLPKRYLSNLRFRTHCFEDPPVCKSNPWTGHHFFEKLSDAFRCVKLLFMLKITELKYLLYLNDCFCGCITDKGPEPGCWLTVESLFCRCWWGGWQTMCESRITNQGALKVDKEDLGGNPTSNNADFQLYMRE